MARIGFAPVNYQASETDGSILFMFSVLEGNIAFDVNVLFETSEGSAQGMNDSGMHTHCLLRYKCQYYHEKPISILICRRPRLQ